MRVVANTSPLHYLVLIAHTAVLPALFDGVLIPTAVAEELRHAHAPEAVRRWMASPPTWLEIRSPRQALVTTAQRLGAGERAALSLSQELHADLVVLDDREAREEAARLALAFMGTLRVLELAAERGLVDFPTAIDRLAATSFHLPAPVVRDMLARDTARRRPL